MRTGTTLALAALLALGFVALDAAAAAVGFDDLLTRDAAASCIEDGVTGRCHSLCVPPPKPDLWACTM